MMQWTFRIDSGAKTPDEKNVQLLDEQIATLIIVHLTSLMKEMKHFSSRIIMCSGNLIRGIKNKTSTPISSGGFAHLGNQNSCDQNKFKTNESLITMVNKFAISLYHKWKSQWPGFFFSREVTCLAKPPQSGNINKPQII